MHLSPVGWPGPAGPAGPVQFPPLLTPAAPTSASFASPSALIPWAIDRGEALSLAFKMSGIDGTEIFILWQENLCGPKVFVMFCSLAAACAGMPRGHTVG